TVKGAALPQVALIKVSAGETAVWVRDGAERFVLRKVSVAPRDAARAAAISGIGNGERIVTEGAGLLAQVR
ncbi:MAG: efflux RND transporter periplasmic adaptor subunit, partial [Rhodocyclaceae bacterium]|nr:efflux RND transporter periplasmic adaptor subunit [Rhodocyclaceae bacterium]